MTGVEILLALLFILIVTYFWLKYHYSYWKRKNVPFIIPKFLVGNFADALLFRKSLAQLFQDIYNNEATKDAPIVGIHIFHKPGLVIQDLELIKRILVKDFNFFSNRYSSADYHSDIVGGYNLFFLRNPLWKKLRGTLSPLFTSGKIKQMFSLVTEIGNKMDSYLRSLELDPKTNSFCLETKDSCALYTTDVIANVAYGIEANSIKNPNSEFRRNGKRIFDFTWKRAIEFSTIFFIPELVGFFKFKVFSKESTIFLRNAINYIIDEREKSGEKRNDLIDILLSLKHSTKHSNSETDIIFDGDILVAQAALFFTAGYETSSATMSFGLYELSRNAAVQRRLRNEIKDVLIQNDGEITYDAILNMKYMNMVIQEVLRLYPPLPFLDRSSTLPNNVSSYSLDPISDFVIPNNMPVYIPIFAIQRDPQYFPDPERFDPERFSLENKDNMRPYSYLPFGTGPRNCMGERFALLQTKVGLFNFLKNHFVRESGKSHKTMVFEKKALNIQAEGGIYCDVVRDSLI